MTARSSKPALLWLERQDHRKDAALMARLEAALKPSFSAFVVHRGGETNASVAVDPRGRLRAWPAWARKPVKALLLLGHPSRWNHYLVWWRGRDAALSKRNSLPERVGTLRAFLANQKAKHPRIVLLGRSINAVTATMLADEYGVEKVIALGYAFRNPRIGHEPVRVRHLEHLRTPCLIVQGTRDIYGGREITKAYRFSAFVEVSFVETDHDFALDDAGWDDLIARLREFIESEPPAPVSRNAGIVSG